MDDLLCTFYARMDKSYVEGLLYGLNIFMGWTYRVLHLFLMLDKFRRQTFRQVCQEECRMHGTDVTRELDCLSFSKREIEENWRADL